MLVNETKMYSEILEAASGCREAVKYNRETLAALVREIKKKKVSCVVLAARGTSDHAAIFGKYLIETYCGIPCALAAPSVYTVYESGMNLKNCLVIGLSQSGKAADALEVINRAKACGAVTLSVTNELESPMAKAAAYHLYCAMGPEYSVAATKTFVGELYLMLMLAAKLSNNDGLKRAITAIPRALQQIFKRNDEIELAARRYCFARDSFVLGRGFAFALAMEFGLKTQETCYLRSRAYATSDFYHGPIAMISDNTPVFLFALGNKLHEDALKMINRVREAGGDVFVFTNDETVLTAANAGFWIQEEEEIPAVFAAAVALQLMACNLSVARGLNPDVPRGLSKVTITK